MPSVLNWGQTVTIVHRTLGAPDARGNDTYTETNEDIPYCSVHPGLSTEVTQGTEEVSDDITVMFPDGTSIKATDAMIVSGDRYEVVGSPNQWQSPFTGIRSFVEVQGRRVTGGSV